jgi:hypothetical protein
MLYQLSYAHHSQCFIGCFADSVKSQYHKTVSHFHRLLLSFDIPANTRLSLPIAAFTSADIGLT